MKDNKSEKLLELIQKIKVTEENKDDIEKMKKLLKQEKYQEILEILKKVNQAEKANESYLEENELYEEDDEEYEEEKTFEKPKYDNAYEENYLEDFNESDLDFHEEEIVSQNIYPKELSNEKLEEEYISLLLANPKAISMYYIEYKDNFFENAEMLNLYKSILFTEGESFAPQIAKDNYNFAKETSKTYEEKKKYKEMAEKGQHNFEKTYVELRKLFEIRKNYIRSPIKEIQNRIIDILKYELYDKMTIQEVKDAIDQIMATEKFKRAVLNNKLTDFLITGDNNLTTGLELPFPILSKVFKGVRKGETMSYAMPSNSGKSRFTINLAAHIAFLENKKVLIISNEMSEEKMRLCLITTVLNNKKMQKLHGQVLTKTEGEILEFKFRPDKGIKVKTDADGFVLKEKNEKQKDFAKRLLEVSNEFRQTIEVTKWIDNQIKNSIYFVNITNHTNDELEKVILNYYYKEKMEYVFYDTLKTDTENIGNGEELKKTATILSNLAQNLNIFIASSLQLAESNTLPINLNINDLAVSRTVKEVLDTLCLMKQIHNEDLDKYEYSLEEVDTKFFDLEKFKDPDVRYYACVVDKNRAGAKPKVLFRLNLAYNMWEELGYLRLK